MAVAQDRRRRRAALRPRGVHTSAGLAAGGKKARLILAGGYGIIPRQQLQEPSPDRGNIEEQEEQGEQKDMAKTPKFAFITTNTNEPDDLKQNHHYP